MEKWEKGGELREGDIVIIIGNKGRVLREGVDLEMDKIMESETKMIGICWGWEYLAWRSGGVIVEGRKRKGEREGHWYNHEDEVKEMSNEWKGKGKWGMWVEGETRKWRGYQYHPEANEKELKKMLKVIRKWRKEKRSRCGVVIKRLKSAKEVARTRKKAYEEWRIGKRHGRRPQSQRAKTRRAGDS